MIGVFDSGYGGLTILRALTDQLPEYDYLYLGDNARAPYGSRTATDIYTFTRQGVDFLFRHGCQLIILGCNTASAIALRKIQQEWLPNYWGQRRVLGIIAPTVEQITGVAWSQDKQYLSAPLGKLAVGVLTTQATAQSKSYEQEIHKRNPSLVVLSQPCPGLVEAIEAHDAVASSQLTEKYLRELMKHGSVDRKLTAVLLGCTHYELIAENIRRLLPSDVRLYKQPTIVAKSLVKYLKKHLEIEGKIAKQKNRHFFTTGSILEVNQHSSTYFGQDISFQKAIINTSS